MRVTALSASLTMIALASATLLAKGETPNVLFIAIDDLNDWVGCLGGHPQATTPNIDRIAARGTLFTNAHCQGPICGPSRASLLSGLYPHSTGVYQQPGQSLENDETHFRGKLLPDYFSSNDYRTFAVGKITHGFREEHAFDEYGTKFAGSGPKPPNGNRFNYFLPDNRWSGTQTDWGAFPQRDEEMPDHKSADWAIEKLNRQYDKPFFLAVGFIRPHVPFYVPQKWFNQFPIHDIHLPTIQNDDLADVPEISRQIHELPKYPRLEFLQRNNNEQFRKCVQSYLACTAFVDHQVGRVLNALDRGVHADNTVVVLFSDHGYHLGEKDRVSKHSLWEESTRVPLVVVPAKTHPLEATKTPKRCDQPVGLIDIFPTLAQLCQLPLRSDNQGMSLVPLMIDPKSTWRKSILTTYARGNHALRSARFRYLRFDDGSEELYDHYNDPHEWTNLADRPEHADLLAEFRGQLPPSEAPYHPATKKNVINAWFDNHLKANGFTDLKYQQ